MKLKYVYTHVFGITNNKFFFEKKKIYIKMPSNLLQKLKNLNYCSYVFGIT